MNLLSWSPLSNNQVHDWHFVGVIIHEYIVHARRRRCCVTATPTGRALGPRAIKLSSPLQAQSSPERNGEGYGNVCTSGSGHSRHYPCHYLSGRQGRDQRRRGERDWCQE